jgi:hypothetical protein
MTGLVPDMHHAHALSMISAVFFDGIADYDPGQNAPPVVTAVITSCV